MNSVKEKIAQAKENKETTLQVEKISEKTFIEICKLSHLKELRIEESLLTHIPDEIGLLTNLEVLKLRSCRIETISPKIGNLIKLKQLEIRSNYGLNTIPAELANLVQLERLDLSANSLTKLPDGLFCNMAKLTNIGLDFNKQLTTLPNSICELQLLEDLDVSRGSIKKLPDDIGNLSNLRSLDISYSPIDELPVSFSRLKGVNLSIGRTKLKCPGFMFYYEFKNEIFEYYKDPSLFKSEYLEAEGKNGVKYWEYTVYKNKTYLSFNSNHKEATFDTPEAALKDFEKKTAAKLKDGYVRVEMEIDHYLLNKINTTIENKSASIDCSIYSVEDMKAVCTISLLKELKIDNYEALEIPAEIGNLVNLERLYIRDGRKTLASIHPNIAKLKNLKIIDINKACFVETPQVLTQLPNLERLELEESRLKSLPENIGNLQHLTLLNIGENDLKTLPESIGRLQALTELKAEKNLLTKLPESFGNLQSLEQLELNDNQLNALPESFGKLSALQEVSLSKNHISQLPQNLSGLKTLHTIFIDRNKLTHLPENIHEIENLQKLDCKFNTISTLPENIEKLKKLSYLAISKNKLSELPNLLSRMTWLNDIQVNHNPFEIPVDTENNNEVLAYYFEKWSDKRYARPKYVAKPDELGLSESQKNEIVKQYEKQIKQFERDTKYENEEDRQDIVDFIIAKTDDIPLFEDEDYLDWQEITNILAPTNQWTFVDRRVFRFITASGWCYLERSNLDDKEAYYHGYYDNFYEKYLPNELKENPNAFDVVLEELKINNVYDEKRVIRNVIEELHKHLFDNDGKANSAGMFLVEQYDQHFDYILEVSEGKVYRSLLFELFGMYKADSFLDKAEGLLFTGDCAPHAALASLCKIAPQKFEHLLHKAISMESSCQACLLKTAKVMLEYYGNKYYQTALEEAKKTIKYIQNKKSEKHDYCFPWEGWWKDGTNDFMKWALTAFKNDIVPQVTTYVEDLTYLNIDLIEIVAVHMGEKGIEIMGEAIKMKDNGNLEDHFTRVFEMLEPYDVSPFYDSIWKVVNYKEIKVNQLAAGFLAKQGDVALNKAIEMAASSDKNEKRAGLMVLTYFTSNDEALKILQENKTTVSDIHLKKMIQNVVGFSYDEVVEMVENAKNTAKFKNPVAKWLNEKNLPELYWKDSGKAVDEAFLRYMFVQQNSNIEIDLLVDVKLLLENISEQNRDTFSANLLAQIEKNGGLKAKNKFTFAILGCLSDKTAIESICEIAIKDKNLNATKLLGINNTDHAVLALDRITKAFKTKYPNVRTQAENALEQIADTRNIGVDELLEIAIPDFGFIGRYKQFIFGGKAYKGFLDTDAKLQFIDENGKTIKSVPSAADAMKKKEIAALNKDITAAKKQQTENLENALVTQRKWSAERWKKLFLTNPLMHALGKTLIWGVYDNNTLIKTFRITNEITFVTETSEYLNISEKNWESDFEVMLGMYGPKPYKERNKKAVSAIGIVHPIDMDEKQKQAWKSILKTEKIKQVFPQIERLIIAKNEKDAEIKFNWMFEKAEIKKFAFDRLGWRRGSVVDAGGVANYRKAFRHAGIDVFIDVDNVNVQGYFDTGYLGKFYFVKAESIYSGSYFYDEPRNETDERLIAMKDIPEIIYSEVVKDLKTIAGEG